MMTVEVYLTEGALDRSRQRELSARMLTALTSEENVPESVLDGMRSLTHVLVHEPSAWATGGAGPHYLVRVTVPGAWHNPALGEHLIPKITAVLSEFAPEPNSVVQLIGLREHSIGIRGRVTTSTEITKLITDDYRTTTPPASTDTDPVCGMPVDPATATITLAHNGVTYAFCAPVCRKIFAEEHAPA